eukprot:gnl/Dysnectes_brevis/44_a53_12722.p1 GENE.gnl/Dysnectes_brevis/44_a53_12722~~gnl/Dysnectes_brevis/44_a53_12722.p1  ORF type:complete len:253 (-),score=63.28 gnl/Dysnectes_brevis/44_a53_12722:109-867(-)
MTSEESFTRDDYVFLAKLNENAERYEEMVETMKEIAKLDPELNVEERNLLSVAYKNVIGPRRAAWRIVSSIESKEKGRPKINQRRIQYIRQYRQKIEQELQDICNDILNLLSSTFLPASTSGEAKVFYFKMQGDYNRYLAEFTTGDQKHDHAEAALVAYKAASEIASVQLPPTHPIRLGLALNFSVFYYEILEAPDRACQLAKKAFDTAISELDHLTEESYKDSTLIMQLLRDNLNLWITDISRSDEHPSDE